MFREKVQKLSISAVHWKRTSESTPAQEDKIYLVTIDEKVAMAAFRQDGNGLWKFNKEGVTHWAEIPEAPKDAEEKDIQVEMES